MTGKELEQIYNKAYKAVYWTAMQFLRNEADAEDVVQDTFISFMESYADLKDTDKAVALLKKIAANKCLDRIKLSKTDIADEEFFDGVEAIPEDFLPDSIIESEDARRIVMDIINNSLSEEIRRTLILFYFDEMSTGEVAEILGVPEGTVRRRLNFARNKIKKEVRKYEEDNDTKLFGMAIPFLIKLFIKESEQVLFKPMPAKLLNLSASAKASGKGANINASKEAVKKGTDIMKTKIAIGIVAPVIAVGATLGIILGIISKNKDNRHINTDVTEISRPDVTEVSPDDTAWTEPSDIKSDMETEDTLTSQQITEDSIFMRMDEMTVDECVDNLWKTSNVHIGTTKEEYFNNIIIPECDLAFGPDDSFSWTFNASRLESERFISSLSVYSAGTTPPVFEKYGDNSLVKLQIHVESEEFADELIDKLIEKFTSEGYAFTSDDTNGDMRVARFNGPGRSYAISRSYLGGIHFVAFDIPLLSE